MSTKLTWTGDVDAAVTAIGRGSYRRGIFNDKHKTCRRLKFVVRDVTDEDLETMQKVIQERRPNLNVTVARWDKGWYGYGNVVVYYRSKNSVSYQD